MKQNHYSPWSRGLAALTIILGFQITAFPAHGAAGKGGKKKAATTSVSDVAPCPATYSGQATAAWMHFNGDLVVIAETGELQPDGGSLLASATDVNVAAGGLQIESVETTAAGADRLTASNATLTNVRISFHSPADVHPINPTGLMVWEASYISASAEAFVNAAGEASASANVIIEGLTLNGEPIEVTGEPNQQFWTAGVLLVINEQVIVANGGSADASVHALHFYNINNDLVNHVRIVGDVDAGVTGEACENPPPPPPPAECGKLTGGGWIIGTPSGQKGTFGVSGGIRRGEFWGHLNYQDHGAGMHVKSTAVTGFEVDPSDANGRIISYDVTINGLAGQAVVRVVDNGEPGRDDIFEITLSTGYDAGGDLGGGRPGGGNIQLHKCPPGWAR